MNGGDLNRDKLDPVAIIGISAKFPQDATSAEAFWQMLGEGRSAMTEVPGDRFNIDAFYHPDADRSDTMNVRGGHFLKEDPAAFDAPFFSIPLAEAVAMDPMQRGLLESTYKALENAGLPLEDTIGSKTCVYVGCFTAEYDTLFKRDPQQLPKYQASGVGAAMLANRLSWFYDLRGPSITLDTACSSSLNALHLACQSVRSGESKMGLVAGCNLILNPDTTTIPLSNLNFLSPDSRCYSFDHRANGYSRGEGFAVVVIKLLSEALRDENTIRAVIRATGANQDGRTPGITQPSKEAQESVIRDTYLAGGLGLETTRFFESHGTATKIGDPVEAAAIGAVFAKKRTPEDPLLVGAVKSNIGHLEGASGLASLIKTVMVLEKGIIPPNIWFERSNSSILAEEWRIKFPLENTPWPTEGLRRASVNSFGYGGANAHVVLDDAYHYMKLRGLTGRHHSVRRRTTCDPLALEEVRSQALLNGNCPDHLGSVPSAHRLRLFIWSSSDEDGIKRLGTVYHDHLSVLSLPTESEADKYFENLSYTLSYKRSRLPWKSYLVSDSIENLSSSLPHNLSRPVRSSGGAPNLGFVFTGQGAQWYAMGRELFAYSVFDDSLQEADKYLQSLGCQWSLIDELYQDEDHSNVDSPEFSQPLCTALQVALTDLLASWGVFPSAAVGHSSGEIAAAYAVGGLSRESAWKVAYFRGFFTTRLAVDSCKQRGAMMSVALSKSDLDPYLAQTAGIGKVAVGCINSPTNITMTGDKASITALKEILEKEEIFARILPVNVAYHSTQMNEIAAEYAAAIQDVAQACPLTPPSHRPRMYSSVTGRYIPIETLNQGEYWVTNLVSRVNFSEALSQMCQPAETPQQLSDGHETTTVDYIVEIGPHSALRRPVKETLGEINYDSVLKMGVSALQTCLDFAGRLFCRGYMINFMALNNPVNGESTVELLTDLPDYPFSRSQVYWHESRISKNFRFRKFARHELLGVPAADWNPSEAKWRNFIKLTENPWIKDHVFDGTELYPAAGMIVMAIEAARQVANPTRAISGYNFKNVTFSKALVLSLAPEGVETEFHLRQRKPNSSGLSEWNDFRLYLYSNNEWLDICWGTIITEFDEAYAEVDNGREEEQERQRLKTIQASSGKNCVRTVVSKQMYDNLNGLGFYFGPTFQTLSDISYSDFGEAKAALRLRDWVQKVPASAENIQQHVIHPTALDGVFQLTIVAITKGGWNRIPIMVPTNIQNMWISNKLLTRPKNEEIRIHSSSTSNGYREAVFDVFALDAVDEEPLVVIENYRATAVNSLEMTSAGESNWRRLCFNIDWNPDHDMLDVEQLSAYCSNAAGTSTIYPEKLVDDLELVCLYFMSAALETISRERLAISKSYLRRYVEWMTKNINRNAAKTILSNPESSSFMHDDQERRVLLDKLQASGPEGNLFVTVGRNLVHILRGEVDALDLLFKDNLMQDFYSSSPFTANNQKAAAYVGLIAHKNPSLSILEIGAGTGGATAPILQVLEPKTGTEDVHGTMRYHQYTYTDVSPAFFEAARERFSGHSDRLYFQTLDIEKDPLQQGFMLEQYDLVIASFVLHATSNIDTTLKNTRKLLKPGGKLILFEPCNLECARSAFAFGVLAGWWLGIEDYRRWGPLLSEQKWHEKLSQHNFSGADCCLRDYEDPVRNSSSIIISTATDTNSASPALPKTFIIATENASLQQEVAQGINARLQSNGLPLCKVVSLPEACTNSLTDTFCIFLPELELPFLRDVQDEDFTSLKKLITSASGVLWVTFGGWTEGPEMGLVSGLGRSIRSENSKSNFVILSLEKTSTVSQSIDHIYKVFQRATTPPYEQIESEYVEKEGVLHTNRIVEANSLNDTISSRVTRQKPELRLFGQEPKRALTLTIGSPGLLDTLHLVDDTVQESLAPGEVEIHVKAVGVNFKNVMVALGQLPDNSLGQECSGVIIRVGSSVESVDLKPGDRVCCVTHSAFKTYARSHLSSVCKIPDALSFSVAAAIPVAYCTAYYALFHLARLKEGDSILIHSAAGGVGQAAIQLAKLAKAEIFVTVGTNEKKRLLMKLYDIPEDRFFSSRNLSFAQGIRRVTRNRGVDVILNSLAGESLRRSFECLAPLGRFIEIGKKDFYLRGDLPMSSFLKGVTFASVDLGIVAEQARPLMADLMRTIMNLITSRPSNFGLPQPLNVYKGSETEKAFRFLQNGKNTGKTVIELNENDLMPTVPSTQPTWYFDANAAYVITGGLGGLGRSVARWMMGRGAKHMMLLSRSGPKTEAAQVLLQELKANGVNVVAPPCDISDEVTLVSVISRYSSFLPPIKGCIQGSMVLKDGLFENMTLENFRLALLPKVQGSWNLHTHLPKKMDFFVLLSSTGGVFGNRGQSNYAAGNTYQDALARHRVSLGEKCISLNLGLILGIGFAAERQEITDALRTAGYEGIHENEFLAMLDYCCNPVLPLAVPSNSQIVTGMGTFASFQLKGDGDAFWMNRPLFRSMRQMDREGTIFAETSKATPGCEELLKSAGSRADAGSIIAQALVKKLSTVLAKPEQDIEIDRPIHVHGVDSLVAVEIRYWFLKEIKADVAVFNILGSESIFVLSLLAAERSEHVPASIKGRADRCQEAR